MDAQERLAALNDKVQAAKEAKFKAEATMQELQRREREIVEKVKAKGYDPERLEQEREDRQQRLNDLLDQADAILGGRAPADTPSVADNSLLVAAVAPVAPNPPISNDVPW